MNRQILHQSQGGSPTELAQGFARLLRERRGQQLGAWVQAVEAAETPELVASAAGLRKDWDACQAGLTLPWSSDPVEAAD